MSGKRKRQVCRICRKRPPWTYKNCPSDVCKKCYHRDVWPERQAAGKQRRAVNDLSGDTPLGDRSARQPFGIMQSIFLHNG